MNKLWILIFSVLLLFSSCNGKQVLIYGDIDTYQDFGFYKLTLSYSGKSEDHKSNENINIRVLPNGFFWGIVKVDESIILTRFDTGGYTIVPTVLNHEIDLKKDSNRAINLGDFFLYNTPDLNINEGQSKSINDLSIEVITDIPNIEYCKLKIYEPKKNNGSKVNKVMEIQLTDDSPFIFDDFEELVTQNENYIYNYYSALESGYYMVRAELYSKKDDEVKLVSYSGVNFFELIMND